MLQCRDYQESINGELIDYHRIYLSDFVRQEHQGTHPLCLKVPSVSLCHLPDRTLEAICCGGGFQCELKAGHMQSKGLML
jgi:hypothetical protein